MAVRAPRGAAPHRGCAKGGRDHPRGEAACSDGQRGRLAAPQRSDGRGDLRRAREAQRPLQTAARTPRTRGARLRRRASLPARRGGCDRYGAGVRAAATGRDGRGLPPAPPPARPTPALRRTRGRRRQPFPRRGPRLARAHRPFGRRQDRDPERARRARGHLRDRLADWRGGPPLRHTSQGPRQRRHGRPPPQGRRVRHLGAQGLRRSSSARRRGCPGCRRAASAPPRSRTRPASPPRRDRSPRSRRRGSPGRGPTRRGRPGRSAG